MSGDKPPEFKRGMTNITAEVGTVTKFLVEIRSQSDLKVSWFHNDAKVTSSDRYVLLKDKNTFSIQIHQLMPQDEGEWVCKVENKWGKIQSSAVLSIQIPKLYQPPKFIGGLHGCLWDNGTLSLECEVMGTPTPILFWYRDGKALSPGSSLTIKAYSKETKSCLGVFCCEARNCMGTKSTFSRVYAKYFANYLKQCAKSQNNPNPPKKIIRKKSIKSKQSNPVHSSDKSEDSGIAVDDQHNL